MDEWMNGWMDLYFKTTVSILKIISFLIAFSSCLQKNNKNKERLVDPIEQ
jgi:hypothetical protein